MSSRGSRSSGSRGFSSGSGFGFRGRRARDSDTLEDVEVNELEDLSRRFYESVASRAAVKEGNPLDVEVNELEDLHSRSHEVDASGKWDLGFVKLTGAAAEAAAKEGKPLAYDDLHDLRQMLIPPSPHRCNYINNTIQEFVSKVGEDYEYREHHEYLRAYYCGLNKAIDENMQTKQQDLARNSNHGLLDMHDLMFAIIRLMLCKSL